MPNLDGRFIPVLRVSDLERSSAWYCRVLRLAEVSTFHSSCGAGQAVLGEPNSELTLCLVTDGRPNQDLASEHRLGLDHLEVVVPDLTQLELWVSHLDDVGVPHSGLKKPEYSQSAMITFRDPDNIQLELFVHRR